jgi:hypothetical protein
MKHLRFLIFFSNSIFLQVKFLLKNMNDETVKLEVDCVTGVGECDDLGKPVLKIRYYIKLDLIVPECGQCDDIQ